MQSTILEVQSMRAGWARPAAVIALLFAVFADRSSANTLVPASAPDATTVASSRIDPALLLLRIGAFDPLTQQIDVDSVGAVAATDTATPRYALVQFQAGHADQKMALTARGIQLLGYAPNNAFYARLNGIALADVIAMPGVRWAGALQPAMKLDPALWKAARKAVQRADDPSRVELILNIFDGASSANVATELQRRLSTAQVTMRSEREGAMPYVRISVSADELDALIENASALDDVYFIGPWHPRHPENSASIGAIQGNSTSDCAGSGSICGSTPLFDHGIVGAGQIIAVADTGVTANAAWFTTLDKGNGPHTEVTLADDPAPVPPQIGTLHPDNKIIAYWLQPGGPTLYDSSGGHGTHVTGTLAGDAAGTFNASTFFSATPYLPNHELADGMAPNAQLLVQDVGPDNASLVIVRDLQGTIEQARAGGAHIHSDSWGGTGSGDYESDDAAADRATRELEDVLLIAAAGNGALNDLATATPANSKNSVAVAALGHGGNLDVANFSSRGPTADGRYKPDVAAPGTNTISAAVGTAPVTSVPIAPQTMVLSGTSMAAPVVAGNAALLREYFVDGFYPRGYRERAVPADDIFHDGFQVSAAGDRINPTGALLKAVLLNSTRPTQTPSQWPNNATGWGRPWLDNNLGFDNTTSGGDDSRRLRVFERTNAAGLRTGETNEYTIENVAPGLEFRATLTWFDVDAMAGAAATLVNDLDLEVVDPNGAVYVGNHFSNGVSATGGTADAIDTVEQVRFTTPIGGKYIIRVKAADVPGNGSSGSDRQGYGLAVSAAFGLPDPIAFPAPKSLAVVANGVGGITIGANAVAGAQSFQLYRAAGTCSTADVGDFHLVANGSSLPLTDDHAQSGFHYAYKLRGVSGDVEGPPSSCIDVLSAGVCSLAPTFDTHSLIADGANASCSVALSWHAAAAECPAATGVTYAVQRSSDPYFGSPATIASGLATPDYSDTNVSNGTPYYYRVVATDSLGNVAAPSTIANISPSGADGPDPSNFVDDVDTHTYFTFDAPWQITNTAAWTGTYSYHAGPDDAPYPDNTCASLVTPPLKLTAGNVLSYRAKYNLEYEFDGVVQEISNDGGATWHDLPPGSYPSSFAMTGASAANGCRYSTSHGAFSGVSTTASNADPNNATATAVFKPFSTDLSFFAGQTVQIRWRLSSDPFTGYSGFFLDEVHIVGMPASGNYVCH